MAAELNCPRCQAPMERGTLDLKAWGIGALPQAQLHFENDLLLKDQYWPIAGFFREGTTASAFRCKGCRLVCFEYGK